MTAMLMFSACGNRPTPKEQVLTVFEEQEELICGKIADYGADDEVEWDDLEGVLSVSKHFNEIIEFECIAEGLMTSSFQAGFYYSPNDDPAYVGWFMGNRLWMSWLRMGMAIRIVTEQIIAITRSVYVRIFIITRKLIRIDVTKYQ